jgi:transposase
MAAKAASAKRYVVRLSAEERQQLEAMIRKGKSPAQRLLKARILLKSDVSEDSEGWSDSRIIEALETSVSMVYRVRKQLVEEGLEAVLSRKAPAAPAVPRIFDGEKDARLIALASSKPPEGYARWSLGLLESKVVEFGIVEAASDSTIQRVLKKKRSPAAPPQILGHPAQGQRRVRSGDGGRFVRATQTARWFVWTRPQSNSSPKRARRSRCGRGFRPASITNTRATGWPTCS